MQISIVVVEGLRLCRIGLTIFLIIQKSRVQGQLAPMALRERIGELNLNWCIFKSGNTMVEQGPML